MFGDDEDLSAMGAEEAASSEEAVVETPEVAPEEEVPESIEDKAARLERELEKRDKAFTKRIAKATRDKYELLGETRAEIANLKAMIQHGLQQNAPKQPQQSAELSPDNFDNINDYVRAMAQEQFRELKAREESERSGVETLSRSTKILQDAAKLGGFTVDDFNSHGRFSEHIAAVLLETDIPEKLTAHLFLNPDEEERISALSPARQAIEIGKLEALLSTPKVVKSNAPAPITPLGTSPVSQGVDPKNTAAWIQKRNLELQRKR